MEEERDARPGAYAGFRPHLAGRRERLAYEGGGGLVAERGDGAGADQGGGQRLGEPRGPGFDVVLAAFGGDQQER